MFTVYISESTRPCLHCQKIASLESIGFCCDAKFSNRGLLLQSELHSWTQTNRFSRKQESYT